MEENEFNLVSSVKRAEQPSPLLVTKYEEFRNPTLPPTLELIPTPSKLAVNLLRDVMIQNEDKSAFRKRSQISY